ncbi:MAG: hypothetical protein LUE24_00490 [Lachnospiraceae bacterium]|nr:hypothetical protein [Lachnospiraceae bacterium]
MADVTARIELYHRLFLVCLGLAILCLVLAIVLFFVLDIRTVLGYLTGRSAKKKIRELEADNAKSGRLSARERTSMQYVAQDMKTDMGVRQPAAPGARKVENAVEQAQPRQPEYTPQPQRQEYAPPPRTAPEPEPQTDLLYSVQEEQATSLLQGAGEQETSLLQEELNPDAATEVLKNSATVSGKFILERELILIHTEEVI